MNFLLEFLKQIEVIKMEKQNVFNFAPMQKHKEMAVNKAGEDIVIVKKTSRPLSDVYAEMTYMGTQKGWPVHCVTFGLSNVQQSIELLNIMSKSGCEIVSIKLEMVEKEFIKETVIEKVIGPQISFDVKTAVPMDKLIQPKSWFKTRVDADID